MSFKKAGSGGDANPNRVSYQAPPPGGVVGGPLSEEGLAHTFEKKDATLSAELEAKLKTFFDKMDIDGDGNITKEEAIKFWGKNFAKVNANSMFHEVDEDGNQQITVDEFMSFWRNVIASGYPEEDVLEEVDMMMEGGSWVDFNDGRTT
jgi:hypothetical protein